MSGICFGFCGVFGGFSLEVLVKDDKTVLRRPGFKSWLVYFVIMKGIPSPPWASSFPDRGRSHTGQPLSSPCSPLSLMSCLRIPFHTFLGLVERNKMVTYEVALRDLSLKGSIPSERKIMRTLSPALH